MLTKDRLTQMGLKEAQIRSREVVHNGGWYNSRGEKIGWGDLNQTDLENIKANLQPGEAFVVLGEADSFWNFVTENGMIGSMCKTDPKEKNPGQEYLIEKAIYVITKDKVIPLSRWGDEEANHAQAEEVIKNAV